MAKEKIHTKKTNPRKIRRIIVHHSGDRNSTYQIIKDWVKKNKNWDRVPYHFVIERAGNIKLGKPETISAGGTLKDSPDSLEVCLCGQFDVEAPPVAEMKTLRLLLKNWCMNYDLTPSNKTIVGHKDVQKMRGEENDEVNKCPGKNLHSQLQKLRTEVQVMISKGTF